jgi:hypothetical protein
LLSITPEPQQAVPFDQSPYKQSVLDFVVGGVDAATSSGKLAAERSQQASTESVA